MNDLHRARQRRLVESSLLRSVEEYEQSLVVQGTIPDPRRLPLNRFRGVLSYLQGAILALVAALIAIVLCFIIFNRLLHFGA